MELGETLWRAIFFTLVLRLWLWLVLSRGWSRTGGDRASAFERGLRYVVAGETFGQGTLSWLFLRR